MAVSKCPCLTFSNAMFNRCQDLIGSYASTHSTFNLIGSCNEHPKIQSRKDTYAHTTDIWAIFFKIAQKRIEIHQSKSQTMNVFSMQWGPLSCEGEKAPIWRCRKTQNPKAFHFLHDIRNSWKPRKPCNIEYRKWHIKHPGHLLNFWSSQRGVK